MNYMWTPFHGRVLGVVGPVGLAAAGAGLLIGVPILGAVDAIDRKMWFDRLKLIGTDGHRTPEEIGRLMGRAGNVFGDIVRWDYGQYSIAVKFFSDETSVVEFVQVGNQVTLMANEKKL